MQMTRRRPDFRFLDDEGDVFVSVSVSGLDWWGDSRSPNWGGGYGIGRQDFDTYRAQGPPTPTPATIRQAIDARVCELSEREAQRALALAPPATELAAEVVSLEAPEFARIAPQQ